MPRLQTTLPTPTFTTPNNFNDGHAPLATQRRSTRLTEAQTRQLDSGQAQETTAAQRKRKSATVDAVSTSPANPLAPSAKQVKKRVSFILLPIRQYLINR